MSIDQAEVAPKLERAVREMTETRLGVEQALTVESETSLIELGVMDSLAVFELVAFIEAEFGLTVPHDALVPEHFDSIAALARLVADLQGAAG